MSYCTLFNKSFIQDINIKDVLIDIDKIRALIDPFDIEKSGLWQPAIITPNSSQFNYVGLLSEASGNIPTRSFDPCNCQNTFSSNNSYDDILDSSSQLNCTYCTNIVGDNTVTWSPKDTEGNSARDTVNISCCNGSCDVRTQKDDFIPKIPYLNQSLIDNFYDFKYLGQFPASQNIPLGFEQFIQTKEDETNSFTGARVCVDWRIQETISEIAYDELTSNYTKKYDHEKAYIKNLKCSKTCGNFLLTKINSDYEFNTISQYPLLSGLIGQTDQNATTNINTIDLLPTPSGFEKPYGFDQQTYNNIYIKNTKAGSYWKWQYQSGVLFWYRYFDVPQNDDVIDNRPIRGVDLYISPGDVFFAKNDGPEPVFDISTADSQGPVRSCPSGLKLVKNNNIHSIIPSGCEFTYISENIYDKFYTIFSKLRSLSEEETERTTYELFTLSALLATAPPYDQITIDLFKREPNYRYAINEYMQLSGFNRDMSVSPIKAASKINFINDNQSLVDTLANKYGSYLWCPPNTQTQIELKKEIDAQCLVDVDFDMVVKNTDTRFSFATCRPPLDCDMNRSRKNFTYAQSISLGNSRLETLLDVSTRYDAKCEEGEMQDPHKSATTAGIALNNKIIKEIPYNTGCYTLSNIYTRINKSNETAFCRDCGPLSSYGLYTRLLGSQVCCSGRANQSFCDHKLARQCDLADPLIYEGDPEAENLKRLRRTIIDGSYYLTRSYPVKAFNGRIDKVAFHSQGGVYFTSKAFGYDNFTIFADNSASLGVGKPTLSFSTQDSAIKVYNIQIEKLRSNRDDSHGCLGFPLPDKLCQCVPINQISGYPYRCDGNRRFTNSPILFTPNVSTKISPKIKAYGGYSEIELNKILGENRIPGHPNPGDFLDFLNKKIDPEYPYGCELVTGAGAVLPNYTNTSWRLNLPNLSTEHADIWVKSLEGTSLSSRYSTKIIVNDVTLYSQQKKKFLEKGSFMAGAVTIGLKNPYFSKLMGQKMDAVLYPPIGTACNSPDLTRVSLEFTRKPRDQILNFVIPNPLNGSGNQLTKGFFHPNSGLQNVISSEDSFYNKSPIIYKKNTKNYFFNYENEIFNTPYNDGYVFVGKLNDNIKKIFNQVHNFDNHKKLRLYIQIGETWYEYRGSNAFGFIQHDTLYPGVPLAFNYLNDEKKNNIYGPIIPSVPKKISQIPFLYNYGNRPLYSSPPNNYPLPILEGARNIRDPDNRSTRIEGVRTYFYVAEKDSPIFSQSDSIRSLSSTEQEQISDSRTDVVLSNSDRYRYKGSGPKNDETSYFLIDYNYLYTNFSDLNIDYLSKNTLGYILNTAKKTYQKVTIINKNNLLQAYEAYIIEKRIYAIDVDQNGNTINSFNKKNITQKYIQVWTEFIFDRSIKYQEFYIDFTNLYTDVNNITSGMDSLIILDKTHILKNEKDVYLSNSEYQTKWYDLLGYDNILSNDITQLLLNKNTILQKYPQSIYDNFFYKTIINNGTFKEYNYRLELEGSLSPVSVHYTGAINYTIHQKYNISSETNSAIISGQHNYLPFMDINFLPIPGIEDNTNADLNQFRSNIASLSNKLFSRDDIRNPRENLRPGLSGYLYISGIYKNLDPSHKWDTPILDPNKESWYWMNIDKNAKLVAALPFRRNKDTFFSSSLRIDDPAYQLYTVADTTSISGTDECVANRIFSPYSNSNAYSYNNNVFNFDNYTTNYAYGNIFETAPIYCDVDRLGACGSEACRIKTLGNISYSGEYIIFKENEIDASILQNIDSVKYLLSYDAGNYNYLSSISKQIPPPYIQRFELDPENPIKPYGQECSRSLVSVRPPRDRYSVFDTEYQRTLENSIVDDHTDIVVKTDIMANEMLFRLMYGEKEKINLNRLDQDLNSIKPVSSNDLLRSKKIEAKDIYKNILYEYDITSDSSNRKISGSISIDGILAVGKNVNVNINGASINISIIRQNGKILIKANAGGQTKDSVIYTEYIDSNNTVVTTDTRPIGSNGRPLPLLASCPGISNRTWGFVNGITSATLMNVPDCRGELVDIEFPYWRMDSFGKGGGPHQCTACCPGLCRLPGDAFCGVCTGPVPGGHAPILFVNVYAGAKFNCYPADYSLCTNRDVGALVIPGDIVEQKTYNLSIDGSTPNRGVMGTCAVHGGVTNLRSGFTDPIRNFGNIESCLVLPIEVWEDGQQIDKSYTGSNKPFLKFMNLPLEVGGFGTIKYFPNSEVVIPDWRWNYISDPTYGPSTQVAFRPAICVGGDPTKCFDETTQDKVADAEVLPAWYRMALWGGFNRVIAQPFGLSSTISMPPSPCGDCYSLDSSDWAGNPHSAPGIGYPGQVCECRPYSYGYCSNRATARNCLCDTLREDYTEFTYDFQYCRYDVTLTGHRKKIIGHRENPSETVTTTTPCDVAAESFSKIKENKWKVGAEFTEECIWYSNDSSGTDWYIYDSSFRQNYDPYDPGCPRNLCNISYNNNTTTIYINNTILCFNNIIRNNCPIITIDLPDNSFTFTETIDSECGICGVDPTSIDMNEQTQKWETVIDSRTCVLGTLLVGENKNFNGPVAIGGYQFTKCGVCNQCNPMSCANDSTANMGMGQCGRSAPGSFPWTTCYSRNGGDVCTAGSIHYRKIGGFPFWTDDWDDVQNIISNLFSYREIGIDVWRDYGSNLPTANPSVKGCDGVVGLPLWTSNGNISAAVIRQWKAQMTYNYSKIAACKGPEYNIEDVVEGVVGECSGLQFRTISYPGIAYRATTGDPEVQSSSIEVLVAFYTYRYKRPKTIQDILLDNNVGNGTSSRCSSLGSQCLGGANINLLEKFKTDDCTKIVGCYDTDAVACRDTDWCCKYNR